MNCPLCNELKSQSYSITKSGFVCSENVMCDFCNFTVNLDTSSNYPLSINEPSIFNDEFQSISNDILKDEVKNYDLNDINISDKTKDKLKSLWKNFENMCDEISNSNAEVEDKFKNFYNNSEYYCKPVCSTNVGKSENNIFNSYNDIKSNMVGKFLSENYSIFSKCETKTVFNWLHFPNAFNAHYTITRILLLHLDAFKLNENEVLDVKHEYEALALFSNYFPRNSIKYLCYNFMKKIYHLINNYEFPMKPNSDLVLNLLTSLLKKKDFDQKFSLEYESVTICNYCGQRLRTSNKRYFLKIAYQFCLSENSVASEIICSKCKNVCCKKLNFTKVPELVIFYFSNGFDGNVNLFENQIKSSNNQNLSVVAVVEYESIYSPTNDQLLSRELYDEPGSSNNSKPSYCVHFRNKNGWYSLNGFAPFLVKPSTDFSINNRGNIRLVILGKISEPHIHHDTRSLKQFIIGHKEYLTKSVLKTCKSEELRKYCTDIINQITVKRSKRRKFLNDTTKIQIGISPMFFGNNFSSVDLDSDYCAISNQQSAGKFVSSSQTASYSSISYSSSGSSSSSGVSSFSSGVDISYSVDREIDREKETSISTRFDSFHFRNLESQSRKRDFIIDDLIDQYGKRLKKKC